MVICKKKLIETVCKGREFKPKKEISPESTFYSIVAKSEIN